MAALKCSAILLVVIVGTSLSLPVQKDAVTFGDNKWEALRGISQKLRRIITVDCQKVRDVALNDNAEIGAAFVAKLDEACVAALAENDKLDAGINARDLTLDQADAIFDRFNEIDVQLRKQVQELLEHFSVTARATIQGIMLGYRTSVNGIGIAVRAILIVGIPGRATPLESNKYAALAKLSGGIRVVINEAGAKVADIAEKDNSEIGADVRAKIQAASVNAAASLDNLDQYISKQSLTLEEADPIFQQLSDGLVELADDLIDNDLPQLSLTARAAIKGILIGSGYAIDGLIFTSRAIIVNGIPDLP